MFIIVADFFFFACSACDFVMLSKEQAYLTPLGISIQKFNRLKNSFYSDTFEVYGHYIIRSLHTKR